MDCGEEVKVKTVAQERNGGGLIWDETEVGEEWVDFGPNLVIKLVTVVLPKCFDQMSC